MASTERRPCVHVLLPLPLPRALRPADAIIPRVPVRGAFRAVPHVRKRRLEIDARKVELATEHMMSTTMDEQKELKLGVRLLRDAAVILLTHEYGHFGLSHATI